MMKKSLILLISSAVFFLAGCATDISSQSYQVGKVGQTSRATPVVVVGARSVQVSGTNSVGRPVGAIAGGVAGSAIGGSGRANILGALGGAVIGGVAGGAIESGATKQTGIEYVVETSSGALITVVQGPEPALAVGQRALLIEGNPARLIADTRTH